MSLACKTVQFAYMVLVMQERLHNFFNNRKPKDLKKARSRLPDSGGSQDNNTGEEQHEHEHQHQQADFSNM